MQDAACCLCGRPLVAVVHADAGPPRPYCQTCAGCDPELDSLSCEAMCDACAHTIAGEYGHATRLRLAAARTQQRC